MFKPIFPLVVISSLLGPLAARADDSTPAPGAVQQPVAPVAVTPPGQWVDTTQYGWMWLPHEQRYTYVAPDASAAYMFAYNPTVGWGWVGAPWVLGIGPIPRWGVYGTDRFAWHAHPWFRVGAYHGSGGHGFGGHYTGHGGYGHR